MARKTGSPRPTDAELEILRVIWEQGPSTVRDVYEVLHKRRGAGYTTVLKLMQIMTEKGLLERNEKQRAHVYQAREAREHTERALVDHLVERAFGGSAARLAIQALAGKRATAEELAEIRRMLDEFEGGKKK